MDQFRDSNNEKKEDRIEIGKTPANAIAANYHSKLPLWYIKSRNTIHYVLSILEVLLLFRFIFMLLGASRESGFIAFLYNVTGIFTAPFEGVFHEYISPGLTSRSVFDPAIPIAMIVYALFALGIVKLLWLKISRESY